MMEIKVILLEIVVGSLLMWGIHRQSSYGYWVNLFLVLCYFSWRTGPSLSPLKLVLCLLLPLLMINTVTFCFSRSSPGAPVPRKYQVRFRFKSGRSSIRNVRRGVAIIGAAGSGKTESVVYNFLRHFRSHCFCGVIHDYKSFELTEIAYPLFKTGNIPFFIISFDQVYHRVNPIAPKYLPDEESVNEVSRVLLENLLEQKGAPPTGSAKFFNDAAEGLIAGLIWKLKENYPDLCTLPHLMALYQHLNNQSLANFLSTNRTSKAMADAFISGIESERQTAAVRSTLGNALKKISTHRIFMALSADEVPLDINNPAHPAVVSVVNNPKFETAYAPVIATVIHTMTKQMSVRKCASSFILLEEAPTIRLIHMHRIPATLRSYDISTLYVMQDKIQNELLYGEKASKAILSNLSYQFFGKVNDPDTAKYYERFFEIVKKKTISTSQGEGLAFDTRVTKSEKEVSKLRADLFFRLQPGEFITFADGKDERVQFALEDIKKELPIRAHQYTPEQIRQNYNRIHEEIRGLFGPAGRE